MSKRSKLSRRAIAAAAIPFFVPSAPSAAAIQYSVVVLSSQGIPHGIDHGIAAGYDSTGLPTVWTNNGATVTHLPLPPGFTNAAPHAVWGNEYAGAGYTASDSFEHAVLWNGTNAVDLGSDAEAAGVYNSIEVGQNGAAHAVAWSGSAASLMDLNPPTFNTYSDATGIWGTEVSGRWYNNPNGAEPHPALWTSLSPAGFVDLSGPGGAGGEALAVSRGQVAGWAGITGVHHAAIWAGTAASFQDLAPAGTTASELWGTNGTQQVGNVSFLPAGDGQPPDFHAAVWTGTAGSYQLLPLPNGAHNRVVYSLAYGIDGEGNIVGTVGPADLPVPVLWVPNRLPGDANFDGSVNVSDLLILAQNYGQPGEWVDGEFSGGGTVDFADLLTLAQHYGQSQTALEYSVVVDVPEPVGLLPLALAGLGALCRRRGRWVGVQCGRSAARE